MRGWVEDCKTVERERFDKINLCDLNNKLIMDCSKVQGKQISSGKFIKIINITEPDEIINKQIWWHVPCSKWEHQNKPIK